MGKTVLDQNRFQDILAEIRSAQKALSNEDPWGAVDHLEKVDTLIKAATSIGPVENWDTSEIIRLAFLRNESGQLWRALFEQETDLEHWETAYRATLEDLFQAASLVDALRDTEVSRDLGFAVHYNLGTFLLDHPNTVADLKDAERSFRRALDFWDAAEHGQRLHYETVSLEVLAIASQRDPQRHAKVISETSICPMPQKPTKSGFDDLLTIIEAAHNFGQALHLAGSLEDGDKFFYAAYPLIAEAIERCGYYASPSHKDIACQFAPVDLACRLQAFLARTRTVQTELAFLGRNERIAYHKESARILREAEPALRILVENNHFGAERISQEYEVCSMLSEMVFHSLLEDGQEAITKVEELEDHMAEAPEFWLVRPFWEIDAFEWMANASIAADQHEMAQSFISSSMEVAQRFFDPEHPEVLRLQERKRVIGNSSPSGKAARKTVTPVP